MRLLDRISPPSQLEAFDPPIALGPSGALLVLLQLAGAMISTR